MRCACKHSTEPNDFVLFFFQIDGGDYIKYLQKKYRKISILELNRNRNIVYVARYSETKSLVHTQTHSRHLTRILKVEVIVSGGCCAFFLNAQNQIEWIYVGLADSS